MDKHVSIKRKKAHKNGLDFDSLRLLGIKYVQELSGAIWTDYNVHDPGVTILEHLCYTLTDLAYRAGFDVEDILYAEEGNGAAHIENGFFPPATILPTAPITPTDYRRLLIDQVREIRNAWYYPIISHNRGYRGLFRIQIQLAEGVDETLRAQEVIGKVKELIMANRNLCEDLEEVIILGTDFLSLSASISIEADAFGEKVMAKILHTIDQLLNPGIRYYSREELEAEGHTTEDIFDGPIPLHGFIKKEDLKPLPASTYVSTIREAITKVEGVKLIDNLTVWKNGLRIRGDEIIPSVNTALRLDPKLADGTGTDGTISLHRNGVPVSINPRHTRQFLNTLSAKAKKGFQTKLDLREPPVISTKKQRDLAAYRSFQRLMPAVYGLGLNGLPATANRKRRAQAYQLKAYLLVFEQFMADYLAQLAHVRDLYSITALSEQPDCDTEHAATYFTQFPADIPDVEHLFYHGLPAKSSRQEILQAINENLQKLSASCDPGDQRRNRFLDHLLARFGEIYNDDALRFLEDSSPEAALHALVEGKAKVLSMYPALSRDRSKAFNYTADAWKNENVSGLKKRVSLELNLTGETDFPFPTYANRDLSLVTLFEGVQLENAPSLPPSGIQLSLLTMLREGIKPQNYDISPKGKGFELSFLDKRAQRSRSKGAAAGARQVEAQRTVLFAGTKQQCTAARDRLIQRFQKINTAGAGCYFLENILLRPENAPGSILVFEAYLEIDEQKGKEKIRLRSLYYTDENSLNNISTDILVIPTHPTNWAILPTGDTFRLVLLKDGRPLLLSKAYVDKNTVATIRQKLQALFLTIRNQDPASINNYLRLETERLGGYEIGATFYSLRLSIISPAWPALLQNQDFRQLFHQVVATHVPAHLSVDYYWLSPDKMAEFGPLFKEWLAAKQAGEKDKAQGLSLRIAHFLRPETVPPKTAPTDHAELHQKLPASIFHQLGASFGYSFLFAPADFSLLQGLPPQVASLLPTLGIPNWTALRKASAKALTEEIHDAGLLATKKQVRNWQKQATLAQQERWTDLLRYQRKALKSGGQAALSITKRTKVEQVVYDLARTPGQVVPRIRRWVMRLPGQAIIPYPVVNYLTQALGYSFLLPQDDLQVFSCIDEAHEKALNARGISTWAKVLTMKPRTWNSVIKELNSGDAATDLATLQQEVTLAVNGDWPALLAFQTPQQPGLPSAALTKRVQYHEEQLMKPMPSGIRPLADQLRRWKITDQKVTIPQATIQRLLEELDYGDLLAEDQLRIFEGIGEQTEAALKSVGITNWQQLQRMEQPEDLPPPARKTLSSAVLSKLKDWAPQAKLAAAGKWSELIEWQKGPVAPTTNEEAQLTALENGIQRWLEQNAQPDGES